MFPGGGFRAQFFVWGEHLIWGRPEVFCFPKRALFHGPKTVFYRSGWRSAPLSRVEIPSLGRKSFKELPCGETLDAPDLPALVKVTRVFVPTELCTLKFRYVPRQPWMSKSGEVRYDAAPLCVRKVTS